MPTSPPSAAPAPPRLLRRINRALLAVGLTVVILLVGSLYSLVRTEQARKTVAGALREEYRITGQAAGKSDGTAQLEALRRRVDDRRRAVRQLVQVTGVLQGVGLLAVLLLLFYVYRRLFPLAQHLEKTVAEKNEAIDRHESTELARQLMIETLTSKNEELDHFAYIASHDLQEPLRTVRNFIDLIEEDHGAALGPEGQTYLSFLHEATARMQRMIHTLLEYSQLGKRSERQPVDLDELLTQAKADLAARFQETGGQLTREPLPVVYGYESELYQLFQNLLSNALKFVQKGRSPEIHVSSTTEASGHVIRVRDRGIGMDEKAQGKVFQMFNRLNKPSEYDGYGIGLAFCRKIVELHGGVLSVSSSPGRGSTFYFTIPPYLIHDETQAEPHSPH